MNTLLSGDTAAALARADDIYNNGADLSMLLTDMMEWTHWATRMHPALHAGDVTSAPYTADQREQIRQINERVTLNTLSRIWQVMVASVPEIQSAGNQKQSFDMLVVRLMHIADMPSVPELLNQPKSAASRPDAGDTKKHNVAPAQIKITNSDELARALQASKEILLYSYYTGNIEVLELSDGHIKYFDRRGDADFAPRLAAWLNDKTGHAWTLERITESPHAHTITEQKQEELESDPMVANAMSLFENAEIVGVK